MASTLEVSVSMAVDHPTGSPPLNCLQLVDVLRCVKVPDWACELQRRPSKGFVRSLFGGHQAHLQVPPQEPEYFAGIGGDTSNVPIPTKVVREHDSQVLGLFGRLQGMAMKVVQMVKHVPLPGDVEELALVRMK